MAKCMTNFLQPREDNPPELNEFFANVLDHRGDFNLVKQAAKKYQKNKKEAQISLSDDFLGDSINPYNEYFDEKIDEKRHVPHHKIKRKFRNLGLLPPNMRNKIQRIRRGAKKSTEEPMSPEINAPSTIKKRFPEFILLQEVDDPIQKRMQPEVAKPEPPKIKHHLPSQIFKEPQQQTIEKRTPQNIVVQSEAENGKLNADEDLKDTVKEKKEAFNFVDEVHHGYKSKGGKVMRDDMRNNQQNNVYYVDLQDAAQKEREKNNERRAFSRTLRRPGYYGNRMYNRPMDRPRTPENFDYLYYPNVHHNIDENVAFEKALSYEIAPRYHDEQEMFNNPDGNSLYSVDAGRPDSYQAFYPQRMYEPRYLSNTGTIQHQYSPQEQSEISNERFFIDNDDNVKRLQTTTTENPANYIQHLNDGKKTVKQVGTGFMEISKARRQNTAENDEDEVLQKKSILPFSKEKTNARGNEQLKDIRNENEQSSILSKHSLHPLRVKDTKLDENDDSFLPNEEMIEYHEQSSPLEERDLSNEVNDEGEEHFQARNLKFIDYENANFYNHDENYEDLPNRARRDFLDSLGMKNEEDYTEENPYKEEMTVDNMDVKNDTHIHNTTKSHKEEDVKNIKNILEEKPKNETTTPVINTCHPHPENKRAKNTAMPVTYLQVKRKSRGATNIETRILENKDKIYNAHEDHDRFNKNHVKVRQQPNVPKWEAEIPKLNLRKYISLQHNLHKKEDSEQTELTESSLEPTTESTTETTEVTTESNSSTESEKEIDTAYEQAAHQMDIENEKLAQVVNGRLASRIVTIVFEKVTKRNGVKSKIVSGLSRKHVNLVGTEDSDIFKSNETEESNEARLLIGQISKVLNKLVINQVRRKLCQRLPDELKDYLEILLNVKNGVESANFVPNDQQGNFLFMYQDNNKVGQPPFDLGRLQDILVKLEGLLLNYHNLNPECQSKAEPVRDYIEKHVQMLKKIMQCPTSHCNSKLLESKRNIPHYNKDLVERQLESVGLGKNQEFVPNFDLDELIKNKMMAHGWKMDDKREVQRAKTFKSPQYRKLQQAVHKVREKRENEKKIAEIFGSKQKRSLNKLGVDYEKPVVYSLG